MDNGHGCSGCRTRFLQRMTEFADGTGPAIRLIYYPPYHSRKGTPFMINMLDFLIKLKERFGQPCAGAIRPCDQLWEAVDLVVRLSHPNIHYVPHYRKKLMPAVEHTLKYADEQIARMPGAIPVTADSYTADPLMRTAFSDVRQFRNFFTGQVELKDFFQKTDAPGCCALLVMTRKERKILGVEMDGEIMKRDVLQISVDFSDHELVAPMISEEETRKELSLRALELLAAQSLENILSLIAWKKEMETEKRILEVKLQLRHAQVRSRNSLFPNRYDKDETDEASSVLEQLDRKIAQVRAELDEPEDYLNKVADLLYHPEQFLKAEPVRMIIDDMNIVVDRKSQKRSDEIRFTEISTGTGDRKAAVLVDCERF